MDDVFLLNAKKYWECPSCGVQSVSDDPKIFAAQHPCPKHYGLMVNMVSVTSNYGLKKGQYEHRINEIEGYEGTGQVLHKLNGRPIRNVETWRPDGQDCNILAPSIVREIK